MRTVYEEIEIAKTELGHAENRLKVLTNRKRDIERRERTHRLIERGAILESLIDEPEKLSNEQVRDLLIIALGTEDASCYLQSLYSRQESPL